MVVIVIGRQSEGHGITPIDFSTKWGNPRCCQQHLQKLGHELLVLLRRSYRLQHPLRAHTVNRLQQEGPHQLFKANRGSSAHGVELAEAGVDPVERLIGQPTHLAQGMSGGDSVFCGDVQEQGTGSSC
jgi:hypothetical protein